MVADVRRIYALPPDLGRLLVLSSAEEYDFVRKLVDEWTDGSNRFDRPGEAMVEGRADGYVVAIGGINVDPYLEDPAVGRLRHVYVDPAYRDLGLGRAIVERLVALGSGRFDRIRVRAGTPGGSGFYEAIGFSVTDEAEATHTRTISGETS